MKIIHLCLGSFFIDKYGYQENLLPKYHVRQGYNVTVVASLVTFDSNGKCCLLNSATEYISDYGFKVIRLNYHKVGRRINILLRRYHGLKKVLTDERADILFIHGCQFWDIHLVANYLSKHPNVKVFVDNHADYNNSAKNWISLNILHKLIWKKCAHAILPFAQKFYGVLPVRCQFLHDVYNISINKIEYLPLGVDDDKLNYLINIDSRNLMRKELNIDNDIFLIVSGGKIDERKNIHLLMEAINSIQYANVRLLLFGTISNDMNNIIHTLLSEKIINIGWVHTEKITEYFLASDLAIFPGTHSVLWEEAVGCGLPLLVKYWDGMQHVDIGGNCKFLNQNSSDEIRNHILEILNNQNVYNQMKHSAMSEKRKMFLYSEIAIKSVKLD